MKTTQNVAFLIFHLRHFSPIFVLLKLSGNTVWPQASGSQKLAKIDHFWLFNELLSTPLRSQCWMRLFGRFSNTVCTLEPPKLVGGGDWAYISHTWDLSTGLFRFLKKIFWLEYILKVKAQVTLQVRDKCGLDAVVLRLVSQIQSLFEIFYFKGKNSK